MVMSISAVKNATQARSYFSKDNYYRKGDSEQTKWGGKLAEEFGIDGHDIDAQLFFQALTGQMPDGSKIQRGGGQGEHKPATDLTFNAPKDISIALYHGGDTRIIGAHQRAIASTMRYAEQNLAACRLTENGITRTVSTGNLLYAQFNHDTNRLEEAHLHDHVLVLNTTRAPDGSMRALENRPLFQNQMLLGAVYHAELRQEMERLGYKTHDLANAKNGEFGLAEIDKNFAAEKSTRRQQVEAWLQKRGIDPASASQQQLDHATKATRSAKREIDHDALHERQRVEFRARFPDWKTPGLESGQQAAFDAAQSERARAALDHAIEHHFETNNAIRPRELLRTSLAESGGVKLAAMQAEIDARLADGQLVAGDKLYTTQSAQDRERAMLAVVDRGRDAMTPVVSAARADELLGPSRQIEAAPVLVSSPGMNLRPTFDVPRGPDGRPLFGNGDTPESKRPPVLDDRMMERNRVGRTNRNAEAAMLTGKLNDGQMRAAELMLTSTDRVNIIQGVAGAGKTHMLETVRGELEANGHNIIGLAPSHQAAGELRKAMGSGQTLQSFLVDPKTREGLNAKSVIICDEAGMASSQQMHDLLKISEASGARVFLVGDDRQFKAVEAGNPFRQLQKHGTAMAEMNESVRQKKADPNLKAAVALMNEGKIKEGLALLPINEIADKGQRYDTIARDYLAQGDERKDSIVLTGTNDDRRALNDRIREGLGLKGKGQEIEVIDKADLSGAEQRKAKNYQPGQVIEFHKDMRRLGVHARESFAVESVDTQSGTLKLRGFADGREIAFQPHQHENTRAWSVMDREKLEFAPGDEVRFRSSQKGADGKGFEWHNNDRGRVIELNRGEGFMRVANDSKDGREVRVDLSKPAAVTHSYAATGHSAQGMTVNRALVDFSAQSPTTTKESIYTNSTRARFDSMIYTDSRPALETRADVGIEKNNALDVKERPALPLAKEEKPPLPEKPTPEAAKDSPADASLPSSEGKGGTPSQPDPQTSTELAGVRERGERDLAASGFYAEHGADHSAENEVEWER